MDTLSQWELNAKANIEAPSDSYDEFTQEEVNEISRRLNLKILALIAVIRKKDEALEHVSQFWRYDTDPIENDSDSNGAIAMNKAFRKCKDALAFTLDFEKELK